MAIIINIDVMLAKRKMSVTELAEKVGITMANISRLEKQPGKRRFGYQLWKRFAKCWNASPGIFWNTKSKNDFYVKKLAIYFSDPEPMGIRLIRISLLGNLPRLSEV